MSRLPPSMDRVPSRVVARPPASSTMTRRAATSQGLTTGSTANSPVGDLGEQRKPGGRVGWHDVLASELACGQEDEGAGLDGLDPRLGECGIRVGVLGAGVEDDPPRPDREDVCDDRRLPLG